MEENYLAKWIADENAEQSADPILNQIKKVSGQLETPDFDKKAVFEQIQQTKTQRQNKVVYWSIAASLIVLLGVSALFLLNKTSIETQAMANKSFMLPDQSKVVLQSASKAEFNPLTWSLRREVQLEGTAFFDVEKGKKFEVKTPNGKVTVLGTKFKVSALQNQLQVRCYEGRVSVEKDGEKSLIKAGDRLIINQKNERQLSRDLGLSFEASGKNEIYIYNKKFTDLLQLLERLYPIQIKAEIKPSQHYTGFIPLYDVDQALQIISQTYQVNLQQRTENSYIFGGNESTEK